MNDQNCGLGPTAELSLRVSVATLSRVIFPHPENGVLMLALEYKASLTPGDADNRVVVKAQPFGGAIRILKLDSLLTLIGSFNFDSERSRSEGDFRIFIHPSRWNEVREFCLRNMDPEDGPDLDYDPSLDIDPGRELVEEFDDALGIQLIPEQYDVRPFGTVVENEPAPTENLRAGDAPTARIYRVYEVQIIDHNLCRMMIANSQAHPSHVLRRLALDDAQKGGPGRANAMLTAPVEQIRAAYLAVPPEMRGAPLPFENTLLDGNVSAVLEGVVAPKYWRSR